LDIFIALLLNPIIMLFLNRFAAVSGFLITIFGCIHGQVNIGAAPVDNIKAITEKKLGLDDLLVNGIQYIPEYSKVAGSPEFEYIESSRAILYIKGQEFDGIRMAYDIVSDHALLIRDFGNGLENRITLYPAHVDSFVIGNHLFINPSNIFSNFKRTGYFEKLSDGEVQFLKKYRKSYLKIYDNNNRGKFTPQIVSFFLLEKDGNLVAIKSKGAFLRYFSSNKKEIREYFKENKIDFRKSAVSDIRNLMNFCNFLPDATL
jgi:hypothetical protein